MREPWEWTEQDLLQIISDGVKESLTLDYKQCASLGRTDKKKDELSKDVSAFANSTGGTLLYGIIENNHLPERLDNGYDPTEISREFIENVINSKIHRRISGIRINQVDLSNGKVVYVLYIPQSTIAPHMAADKRFYKRFNFSSVPMEEYEVRDIANRYTAPDLYMQISLNGIPIEFTMIPVTLDSHGNPNPFYVDMSIVNHSTSPAKYTIFTISLGEQVQIVQSSSEFTDSRDEYVAIGGTNVKCHTLQINYAIPGKMPIWNGVNWTILKNTFKISLPKNPRFHLFGYGIHSAGMKSRNMLFSLSLEGNIIKIVPAERSHFS
jgi:hypothetical protein